MIARRRAHLVSSLVWSGCLRVSQKSYSSSPTLYAFPLPASSALCHSQLVRHPAGREPGVLAVSPQGEVRFWEGVSQALVGGGERFVSGEVLGLADDELVTDINEAEVSDCDPLWCPVRGRA